MPKLEIHLADGFENDDVELRINGKTAAHHDRLSTNYSIGLAAQTDLEVPAGPSRVEIILKGKPAVSKELHVEADTYLIIRKQDGNLQIESTNEPPAYF